MRRMISLCLVPVFALAQLYPGLLLGQDPPTRPVIDLINVAYDVNGEVEDSEPGVHGASIDFQIGRDNLAFANPSGVLSSRVAGGGGDCYAMAFTTKMFFEGARPGRP